MTRRQPISGLAIGTCLILLFLFAPLAVATLYAFNSSSSLSWPFAGFSTRWFEKIFTDQRFISSLETSFQAAILTAILATAIGTFAAFAFSRVYSRLGSAGQALGRLPVMLPPVFIGIGFIAFMRVTSWSPGLPTIVLGHTVVAIPWVILVMLSRLRSFDVELEFAARDLGAGAWQTIRRITIPTIAPAMLGAALLAFSWSFDETLITTFTAGTETTVPLYILGKMRRLIDPSGNAVATILLLIPWIAFGLAALAFRRSGTGLGAVLGQQGR